MDNKLTRKTYNKKLAKQFLAEREFMAGKSNIEVLDYSLYQEQLNWIDFCLAEDNKQVKMLLGAKRVAGNKENYIKNYLKSHKTEEHLKNTLANSMSKITADFSSGVEAVVQKLSDFLDSKKQEEHSKKFVKNMEVNVAKLAIYAITEPITLINKGINAIKGGNK